MAENSTNKILILTFDGEYITDDKDLIINPFEIVCTIDATGCSEERIEEMKKTIALADWITFCAACECETSHFTVAEAINFANSLGDHYTFLPNVRSKHELGRYVYEKFWDTNKYEGIRKYVDFAYLGYDLIIGGQAAETSYGYVLITW